MKKLLTLLLFSPIILFSQTDLSVSAGAAIPLGNFGSNDLDNADAKFAGMGTTMSGSIGARLTEVFGLNTSFIYTLNPVDDESLRKALIQSSGYDIEFRNKIRSFGILGGFYFRTGSDLIRFTGRLNGGYINIKDADYVLLSDINNNITVKHDPSGAFALMVEAGLNFPISEKISFDIVANYIRSTTQVNYIGYSGGGRINDSFELTFQNISTCARISFHL